MEQGQSDGRIVLMKVGNATGRKPKKGCTSQSCHAKSYGQGNIIHAQKWSSIMETVLARISQLSSKNKANPEFRFTSVVHIINKELLTSCHESMEKDKAVGIDGVTKEDYEKDLDQNLDGLINRMKRNAYKPKPARRVEIPKDNGKMRTLSIYCYEDKLVQEAIRRILEAIFEPMFYDVMMGFRPGRSCHGALKKLNVMLERKFTNYVLDADIKGFFDHLSHQWIMKFIGSRIIDPNFLRLVNRMLKAGIMEDFEVEPTEEGSGQGSVCSPIIANIYMHYVLAWWFVERVRPQLKGYGGLVIYADDFVACFQNKWEAMNFYKALKRRMEYFGLSLEEEKSRLLEFGRFATANRQKEGKCKPETFSFLGFTHYCSESRNGKFRVKRKTSRKKFIKKCREIGNRIKEMRILPIAEIIAKLNQILVGYFHYYGITDNFDGLNDFCYVVRRKLFYWLNRRSQKKSYNWTEFNNLLKDYPLARPKICVSIYG